MAVGWLLRAHFTAEGIVVGVVDPAEFGVEGMKEPCIRQYAFVRARWLAYQIVFTSMAVREYSSFDGSYISCSQFGAAAI